ncbi:hypothetical protein KTE28_18500 [Burkholderia multivorans]|uniref:hypothetical protein n=1 Tax=Burkholderia multivorans TaxID=87883 RepID=UPI00158929BE|nr:hypothetical protein [Burkholderia multivorans]MBU9376320.1 hypothetical protein [Burkholderia multivorans]MBU9528251.1 hypothetical protein [Burkholderia multivorans]
MIVVRTMTTTGGVRPGRKFARRIDRFARMLGHRNAKAWIAAEMERQLLKQAELMQSRLKEAA